LTWAGDSLTAKTGTGTAWSYDAAGNRVNHQIYTNNVLGKDISYSYDVANRLWSMGSKTYANDEAGARITKIDGTIHWTYQYDGESRLVKALNNGVMVTENTYDGSGMRVKKIADGKTVYFEYNGNESLIEYSAIDSKYTYFIYAGKQAVAEESGGVIKFYHKDHLGSTRVVTDTSGAKIAEYIYEPFGKVIAGTDGEQSFTGKKEDSTGLIYFGARFYDPEIGRFITQDLAKQGLNWFAYCGNNPISRIDPNGMYWGSLHGKLTRDAAAAVGITDAKAVKAMVNANVCTDYHDSRNKAEYDWARHFDNPLTKGDDRENFANEEFQKAVGAYNSGDEQAAYDHLGLGLHSLQDAYSHDGILGFWNVTHTLARWLGYDVDDPKNNPDAYNKALEKSKQYLQNFIDVTGFGSNNSTQSSGEKAAAEYGMACVGAKSF
jgi:RHS repeat-associated protein